MSCDFENSSNCCVCSDLVTNPPSVICSDCLGEFHEDDCGNSKKCHDCATKTQ